MDILSSGVKKVITLQCSLLAQLKNCMYLEQFLGLSQFHIGTGSLSFSGKYRRSAENLRLSVA